jgi:hypothetical protein
MSERDDLQSLWATQKEEAFSMSLADLQARASLLQSRVRRRNAIEYAAGALVVGAFSWVAVSANGIVTQAAAVLIALGAVYVCWRLYALARAAAVHGFETAESCADFHRGELVRQRDALQGIWRWYLGPLVPGLVLFWIGVGISPTVELPLFGRIALSVVGLGVGAALFFGIARANAAAAKALQAEIDAIDRMRTTD